MLRVGCFGTQWVVAVALAGMPCVAADVAAQDADVTLTEVVVTARRTEESLQKTPVAVTALTIDELDARAARDLRDLARFTPNAYMSAVVHSADTITMFVRGVGLADFFATTDPGVGLYVGGVYFARSDDSTAIDRCDHAAVCAARARKMRTRVIACRPVG